MTDHAHSDLAHKGDPSLDRMLFFSDGVFAIAITLLSIELHPPHDWDSTFAGLIRESWPMLSAFALSFLVIGVFWNAHRRLFLRMTRFTNGVFVQLPRLAAEIGLFQVRLRADTDIFARRHGQRARDQSRAAGDQHGTWIRGCARDADDQAGRRKDAIIGTKYRRA